MDTKQQMAARIARDLYPHYDQIAPLGSGGMGDIYRGRKISLNLPVVIKIIKSNLKGRLNERQEAEILKSLKHKYLPRVYDVLETADGLLYTVMDFIPGDNLKEYVLKNGAIDQKTAYKWAKQLCEVTAYLHEQTPAIIHSDIKPSNLMIMPNGDICLIDFNTSLQLRAGLTAIGKTKGYAAPEQYTKPEQVLMEMQKAAGLETSTGKETIMVAGEPGQEDATIFQDGSSTGTGSVTQLPASSVSSSHIGRMRSSLVSTAATQTTRSNYYGTVTKRTDVYSIGATIYFALTGESPPHSLEPAIPIMTFHLPVSRSLIQIIDRAMQKNPEDRFIDAAEMEKALDDIHRLDGNYRKARMLTAAGIILELVLLFGGIGLMMAGSVQLRKERINSYVHILNEAQLAKNKGEYETALTLTQKARTLMDTRMEAYAERAAVYYTQAVNTMDTAKRKELFKSCVNTVQELIQANLEGGSDEEWAKVYFVGAESSSELENYQLAQKWYALSLGFAPTENTYRGLICAYAFDNKIKEAKETLNAMRTALPTADTESVAALIEAELCYLDKDYTGAIEKYQQLFEICQDETTLRRAYLAANNACVYAGNDSILDRISILEEACDRLPSSQSIFKPLLANAYFTNAYVDKDNTVAWLEKALECYRSIGTENLKLSDRLIMDEILIYQGNYLEAEEDLLLLDEAYPDDYRIKMRLATVYRLKLSEPGGQKADTAKKALAYYQEAKSCYENSGDVDPAMEAFLDSWKGLEEKLKS